MNDRILAILKEQTAASISCVNELNEPYSFSCFFAFNSTENLLNQLSMTDNIAGIFRKYSWQREEKATIQFA